MIVRIAVIDDYDALLPLFLDLRRFSRERHSSQTDDFEAVLSASREYLLEILNRGADANTFLAVEEDGAFAGYLVAVIQPPNPLTSSGAFRTGMIDELYVDDRYRGSGAGSALLARAEDWFLNCGAERLEVGAYAWNTEAIAFYEQYDFEPWAVTLAKLLKTGTS